jgi:1-aminocyclopropane-1-carboxylate deaminase/D-cysteine desulfhydrase-like pyridoxal-dependent ACC family enzyme
MIPTGGSNAVGARGYHQAALEVLNQAAADGTSFEAVVVACGSGGTLAGLAAGLGDVNWPGQLLGISVSAPAAAATKKVTGLAADLTRQAIPVTIDDRFIGAGYGIATADGVEAIKLFGRTEGVLLDPVYTGKAAAGLIAHARAWSGDVLFVHTGGSPALFAYEEDLA